jgi:hypothetical protein
MDPVIDFWGANWRAIRAYWLALRLPCARCGLPIDYDTGRYLKRAGGTKIVNPWLLVLGHVIGRDQVEAAGWSDDGINSRANTQPSMCAAVPRAAQSMCRRYSVRVRTAGPGDAHRAGHRSWPRSLARPPYLADHFSLGSPVRGMSTRRHP